MLDFSERNHGVFVFCSVLFEMRVSSRLPYKSFYGLHVLVFVYWLLVYVDAAANPSSCFFLATMSLKVLMSS
jgi:hypothetical protein